MRAHSHETSAPSSQADTMSKPVIEEFPAATVESNRLDHASPPFNIVPLVLGLLTVAIVAIAVVKRRLMADAAGRLRSRTRGRKVYLVAGLIAVIAGIFPTWVIEERDRSGHVRKQQREYGLLFASPTVGDYTTTRVDVAVLAVEWACVAITVATVRVVASRPRQLDLARN